MDLAVGDHVRPRGTDLPEETHRVVGLPDGDVTLLQVTDDGRRASTGRVVTVDADDLDSFVRAEDPDAGFDPVGTVLEGLEGIRILLGRLVGR